AAVRADGALRGNATSHRADAGNIVATARAAERKTGDAPLRLSRAVQRRARAAGVVRAVIRQVDRAVSPVARLRAARAPRHRRCGAASAPAKARTEAVTATLGLGGAAAPPPPRGDEG